MSEQNKAVALKFIHAMGRSDAKAAAECLAPDAFTVARGFGNFAGVREHDTIVGMVAAFGELLGPEGLNPSIVSVTGEGERVVVEFEGAATTRTGVPYNNQYCMVFTLLDGKIKKVHEYFCTKLADEVLYPIVAEMEQAAKS